MFNTLLIGPLLPSLTSLSTFPGGYDIAVDVSGRGGGNIMSIYAYKRLAGGLLKGLDGRLDKGCYNRASIARRAAY